MTQTDMPLLPLFSYLDQSVAERATVARLSSTDRAEPKQLLLAREAQVLAFPVHRDRRAVRRLLDRYLGLLERHTREAANGIFERICTTPIRERLIGLGMSSQQINAELYRVRVAMAAMHQSLTDQERQEEERYER